MNVKYTSEGKLTEFRIWLAQVWYVHCKEVLDWEGKQVGYTMSEWAVKNKWFLKHKFKTERRYE